MAAGYVFVFKERNISPGGPLGLSYSQLLGTTDRVICYVYENRPGPRVVTGKWLMKNLKIKYKAQKENLDQSKN